MSLAALAWVAASLADGEEDKRFAHPLWSLPPIPRSRLAFWLLKAGDECARFRCLVLTRNTSVLSSFMQASARYVVSDEILRSQTGRCGESHRDIGASLQQGWKNWLDDLGSTLTGIRDAPGYVLGETLAVTPGDVVYRNRLIEVIRYHPTQKSAVAANFYRASVVMRYRTMYGGSLTNTFMITLR
jgi:polyhydroxyalkanoate synthase